MDAPIKLILTVAAFLLCLGAFFGSWYSTPVTEPYRWRGSLGWLGLACWIFSSMIRG